MKYRNQFKKKTGHCRFFHAIGTTCINRNCRFKHNPQPWGFHCPYYCSHGRCTNDRCELLHCSNRDDCNVIHGTNKSRHDLKPCSNRDVRPQKNQQKRGRDMIQSSSYSRSSYSSSQSPSQSPSKRRKRSRSRSRSSVRKF